MVSNHGDQCTNWGSLKLKSLSIAAVREELEFKVSHKLQTTVVGEKLLNLGGPVVSAFQVSCLALDGIAHETAPWICVLNPVEGLWSHQDVNTLHLRHRLPSNRGCSTSGSGDPQDKQKGFN